MKKAGNPKVSVIIAAYNEERHLKRTLTDLVHCPTAEEKIVVNDGSTDNTENEARRFLPKIKIISYQKNLGKGYALYRGIKEAKGEVIVFLDAHLKNLQEKHLRILTEPILKGKTNYTFAIGKKTFYEMPWATGARAYWRKLLIPHIEPLKKTRFGVEVYLNEVFPLKWGKLFRFPDLVHLEKYQKMAKSEVLPAYLKEGLEIAKTRVELKINQYKKIQRLLGAKGWKSIGNLSRKIKEISDEEVTDLFKKYILPLIKEAGDQLD